MARHGGDQEKVDDPPHAQQAESEKPDRSRDGLTEIEAVRAGEAEDPEQVADGFGMGGHVGDVKMMKREPSRGCGVIAKPCREVCFGKITGGEIEHSHITLSLCREQLEPIPPEKQPVGYECCALVAV